MHLLSDLERHLPNFRNLNLPYSYPYSRYTYYSPVTVQAHIVE